jgi:DNA polymerase (family 10)
VDNHAIADRLDAFAALLDLAGASYYTARAYRRAAELIRSTPAPIENLVREGRVRELHGIGAGIEARLRELIETGEIEELAELERTTAPELVGFGRLIGIGPQRMADLGGFLDVRTVAELRAAADRLEQVPGVGAKTAAQIRAGLERADRRRPPRGLLLNRAWALAGPIAEALEGEVAGDPRRWKDASERLAVVTSRPDAAEAFAALPQIVAVLEPGLGVTVEGVPVELAVAEPGRYGTELFRATGPPEYVDARAAPRRGGRGVALRGARAPLSPAGAARLPRRADSRRTARARGGSR